MRLSDQLRTAIWANAFSGTAFLHVPKAAGSSVHSGLRSKGILTLDYRALVGAHRTSCRCSAPMCHHALEVEERFLREVRTDRPWVLDLGHLRLTADDAADLPPGLPIVVPLRPNPDRIVSLFLFNWTQYAYERDMRAVFSRSVTFAWSPGRRTRKGTRLFWGDADRSEVRSLIVEVPLLGAYIAADGRSVLWREWAEVGLASGTGNIFWYADLLPDLGGVDDSRWSRLVPIPMDQLAAWLERDFGVAMPHVNRSLDRFGDLDVHAAADELRAVAGDYAVRDEPTWSMLQARLGELPSPG